jgi:hypothetical protein
MENEAAAGLDRTSVVDRAIRCLSRIDLELAEQSAEADPRALVPDTNADRTVLVVDAHRDHGALEARIGHPGHGEKQLARQETRLFNHAARMGRWGAAGKP